MAYPQVPLLRSILPVLTGLFTLLSTLSTWGQQSPSGGPVDRDEIVHVLNRITFGPRPGDVEMVQKMGLRNYIEQQLHPETIDDSAVERELVGFDLLQKTPPQLSQFVRDDIKRFIDNQKQLAVANGQAQVAQTMAGASAGQDSTQTNSQTQVEPMTEAPTGDKVASLIQKAIQYRSVATIGQLEQAKLVRAVDSQRQLQEVLVDFWGNHFNIDMKKGPDRALKVVDDREVIRPHIWGSFRDLLEASAKSPAMLFYLDNATNSVERTVTPMDQQYIEQYKDNLTKSGYATLAALVPPAPAVGEKRGGINENYAREIMELHTLGVDGGYTQQDVQEVARCFTGWSIDRQTGEFVYRLLQHDNGSKVVLGHVIPAGGGMQDGETVLDILCSNPATAHHIALEMCQRFVSDDPPAALVDRIAGVFTQTGGNLRQVTEAILISPEFLSPANYNNKIKSPLEFAVSAVRASESSIIPQQPPPFDKLVPAIEGAAIYGNNQASEIISKRPRKSLNWHIYELGEPLFACTPPTGYKEVSKFWVSPGALIERLNFALALTQQKIYDVNFHPQTILNGIDLDKPEAVLDQCVNVLLQNNITDSTRKVLENTALPTPGDSQTVDPSKLIALIIGSPEFQRK